MNAAETLIALAERCEAATGPDKQIDAEIVAALNNALLKPYPPATDFGPHDHWQFWSLDGQHFLGSEGKFKVLPVTASLDAAMTLVSEGLAIDLRIPRLPGGRAVDLWAINGLVAAAKAATPALALCAAALRARAAQ